MTDSKALIERLRADWPEILVEKHWMMDSDAIEEQRREAADHIEKLEAELDRCRKSNAVMDNTVRELEADNARLRRDKETLLTFAQAIQTWRSDADSYDRECEHPQRNYCEDVELIEKAAGYALRRVAERAALQETSHD